MKNEIVAQTKSLFISAGHSDSDPGAVGIDGVTEADVVLDFRDLVAMELRRKGVSFNKDGDVGENLPLAQAYRLASTHDLAVEFHCNAFSDPRATGVETLSSTKHYKEGAALCEEISRTLDIANRGAKGESDGRHSRLAFISRGGGIIVELFFITNPRDLHQYKVRKLDLAEAVADVLLSLVVGEI